MSSSQKNQSPTVSIIIPTLNEESSIGQTLDALTKISKPLEVIVVDGGSSDKTVQIVRKSNVKLIAARRGRGAQLHAGACIAQGETFWFLHADTIVPTDARQRIADALLDPQVIAGNFDVRFDGRGGAARFMTWLYPQLRRLGLSYGDSAIFVRREAYNQIGGFQPFPIFEDLDLIKRLRKQGRVAHLPDLVVTSSRRFEGRSFAVTFARWASLQVLYWLGVKPSTLARFYTAIREAPGQVERVDLGLSEGRKL